MIAVAFNSYELNSNNQDNLVRLKIGMRTVYERKLLYDDIIYNNKDKLECALILMQNPCAKIRECEFCANLLLSKKLNQKELFKIIQEYKVDKSPENICLKNMNSKRFNYCDYELEERYNFDYLINNYAPNQNKIKKFLTTILVKKVFKDAYKILFGNVDYKLLNERYLDELINKRLKFAPIRPFDSTALSDKMSLNTYIAAQKREMSDEELDGTKLLLKTGCYALIEEHEIFHLLGCLPHYENNCSLSIKTPRKKNYEGKAEGGLYLEFLLFNRELKKINLGEALYILNESNYDKSLSDFKEGFKKLDKKDLKITGVFSEFNEYIDFNNITPSKLENSYIKTKSSNKEKSYIIKYKLNNDVFGNKPYII